MERLSDIEEYKDIIFLCKFVDPQFLDSLLDGNLYMNTLGHFIEQEEKTKIRGQGDKYEGAHVFEVQNVQLIDPKTGAVIATSKNGMFQERYEGVRDIPVFCFTKFTAEDFKVLEKGEGTVSIMLDIDEEEKDKFLENFGSKVVMLPGGFINMIEEDALKQEHEFTIRSIKYEEYKVVSKERKKAFEEKSVEIITWKDKFFEYQREMRFAILDNPTKEPMIFKMRSIRDGALIIDAEKFLKEYFMQLNFKEIAQD